MFIAEASPVHRVAVFLVIYRLSTPSPTSAPTPPASGTIVCRGPAGPSAPRVAQRHYLASRARRCPRRPPSQPALYAPARTPPGRGRDRGRRKPAPTQRARKPRGPPAPAPGQQKAHAWPPPFSAHHRVPVFPSRFHISPVHPALAASLGCQSAARLKPALFLGSRRKAPESPLWRGREAQGGPSTSHSPVQLREPSSQHAAGEQYPRSSHAYSIWHPFAYTPGRHCSISL